MKGVKGILLMAGKGSRFDDPIPKQFHLLEGKKVYQWTLEQFISSNLFDEILLVCAPEQIAEVQTETSARVIAGGATRQESSNLGLLACAPDTEIVVIHDAVRPFVSHDILRRNIELAKIHGAVDTCIPSADTLVYAPDGNTIEEIPSRSHYLRGQTPQSFSYPLILEAHKKATQSNSTDDCALVKALGKKVFITKGNELNLKITTQMDLQIAKSLLLKNHLITS